MQGFRGAHPYNSAGKHTVCVNGDLSVPASATNAILKLSSPTNQYNATEIFQELFQAGSTIAQRAQGGTRTVQGTYRINGNLCLPADPAKRSQVRTVQILTHGVGLEKSYWDIAPGYSHVDAAATAGYATFAYDRLGVGQSDHPDPIQQVQTFLEVEILHGLATLFRAKKIDGHGLTNIIGVGHSFGSILQVGANSKYPKDFDGVVLTAFTNTLSNLPYTVLANNPAIAALNQPSRFGQLPYGYLVHNDAIAIQEVYFRYPYFDSTIFQNQVDRKDTYTLGEVFTNGGVLTPATEYTGPLDVVTGVYDYSFCLGNCLYPDNQLVKVKPSLYPAVNNTKAEVYLVPDNGHYLNAHTSAGKLDGYDISSSQVPPQPWLPTNVSLVTLDALAEIPDSHVGKYDVIHIGLLVLVAGDDPLPLLRNVIRLLIRSLKKMVCNGGLVDVRAHQFSILDEIAHPWTHMHFLSVGELNKNVENSDGDAKEWWDLYTIAIDEARNGASTRMGMVVALRLPLPPSNHMFLLNLIRIRE
ncbi:MAG: hypothetical protein Q9184_003386 [Pyrenodesmia sp. 2 TL-2023]